MNSIIDYLLEDEEDFEMKDIEPEPIANVINLVRGDDILSDTPAPPAVFNNGQIHFENDSAWYLVSSVFHNGRRINASELMEWEQTLLASTRTNRAVENSAIFWYRSQPAGNSIRHYWIEIGPPQL